MFQHRKSKTFYNSKKLIYQDRKIRNLTEFFDKITKETPYYKNSIKIKTINTIDCKFNNQILKENSIILKEEIETTQTKEEKIKNFSEKSPSKKKELPVFLKKFENTLKKIGSDPNKIKTEHQIITNGLPVHAKVRPLTQDKLTVTKNIFKELLEMKIISPSNSNWSSALLMKKNQTGIGDTAEITES